MGVLSRRFLAHEVIPQAWHADENSMDASQQHGEAIRHVTGSDNRRKLSRRPATLLLLFIVFALVALVRPAARPYTLNLVDPVCLNMIPMNSYSAMLDGNWNYITDDEIPAEWVDERIKGVLISSSTGALFSADGTTLKYGNTAKAGPCAKGPIE